MNYYAIPIETPEISVEVQKKLLAAGYKWSGREKILNIPIKFIFVGVVYLSYSSLGIKDLYDDGNSYTFIRPENVSRQFPPKTHKITIDGKEIEISHESFENLRKELVGE